MPSARPIFEDFVSHVVKVKIGIGGNHSCQFQILDEIVSKSGVGPNFDKKVAMATTKGLSIICKFHSFANTD